MRRLSPINQEGLVKQVRDEKANASLVLSFGCKKNKQSKRHRVHAEVQKSGRHTARRVTTFTCSRNNAPALPAGKKLFT